MAESGRGLTLIDMTRINGGGINTQLNPFGPQAQASNQAGQSASVGEQVQKALFGKPKPPVLDPAKFPHLAEQMKTLHKFRKKLATMAGDEEDDYDLCLADGTIAMIDEDGLIYIGAGFLESCKDHEEVLVGVLAHEIGHRPKRWHEYQSRQTLTQQDIQALCREEETRADIFAGKALAEMNLSCEPLVEFLRKIQQKPHPEYFDAKTRGEVIRDAHSGRAYRTDHRKKLFPEFDRMTSPKGHLGEF